MLGKVSGVKFNNQGITHGSGLASGIDVQNARQGEEFAKKIMRGCGKMPKHASAQTVMNASAAASNMKASAGFVKDMVKYKLEQVDAGLEVFEAHVAMDEGLQQRETKYQQIQDRHSRSKLDARYQQGLIQAGNQGNYQAYTKVSRIDSL